jgi:polar amino acid transport system permease protein
MAHAGEAAAIEEAVSRRLAAFARAQQIRLALVWLGLAGALGWLFARFRFDYGFMVGWAAFLARGVPITIGVSVVSITLALVLGLVAALGRLSGNPVAHGVATFYTSFIRGTPLLVQVYLIYLGLPQLGIVLDAIPSGVAALSINYGAYIAEIIRAGILSVGRGQVEAALSLGMTRGQVMRRIVLPQALRVVVPPVGNEFIAMLKDSALVSVMGVWELTFRATKIGRQYFRSLEMLVFAAAIYWGLTILFSTLQSRVEGRLARAYER